MDIVYRGNELLNSGTVEVRRLGLFLGWVVGLLGWPVQGSFGEVAVMEFGLKGRHRFVAYLSRTSRGSRQSA